MRVKSDISYVMFTMAIQLVKYCFLSTYYHPLKMYPLYIFWSLWLSSYLKNELEPLDLLSWVYAVTLIIENETFEQDNMFRHT